MIHQQTSASTTPSNPRYPDIKVRLTGHDGNAFAIIARVTSAMRQAGVPRDERQTFLDEATSGDYGHLLQTCIKWVHVS